LKILIHAIIRIILRLFYGISLNQPIEDRQCIVISNHNSHLDVFVLFCLFPLSRIKSVRAVAAHDYFQSGLKGSGAKYLFNALLIERAHAMPPGAALKPVQEALERGESILVFPEGTRSEPGILQPFKSGIGTLAQEFPDIPIHPVCLQGIEKTLPKKGVVPVPFSIGIRLLSSVTGRQLIEKSGTDDRKAISAELEARIRQGLVENGMGEISQKEN
jgi:1-acyl-sn-glycerol-3-phosphate acyltransferase